MAMIYGGSILFWMIYFQFIDWLFQRAQGLGYFEFFSSVSL